MVLMISASKPLTAFVNARPTVIILCLSFLLMIGFSLVAEGFGFHIPKGYLYAAIGFSIMIEVFNQTMRRNRQRSLLGSARHLRDRTAQAVLRLLGAGGAEESGEPSKPASPTTSRRRWRCSARTSCRWCRACSTWPSGRCARS